MPDKDLLLKAVRAELEKVRRRKAKRQADLQEAQSAANLRNIGQLILANRALPKRGATEITVANWYEGGAQVTIPLQPHLDPVENAQLYFKRCHKARKAMTILPRLLRVDSQEEEWLAALQEKVAIAEAPEEIASLAEQFLSKGYHSQRLAAEPGMTEKRARLPKGVRVYDDIGGFRVLVGTNAEGNETLLRQLSSPDDIWLHTRGARGAHAIIKTNRHPERVSQQAIEKAAALAAHFSEERGASTVAVDYTLRKYVRKVRGAAAGRVRYERGKTVLVEPLARAPTRSPLGESE